MGGEWVGRRFMADAGIASSIRRVPLAPTLDALALQVVEEMPRNLMPVGACDEYLAG